MTYEQYLEEKGFRILRKNEVIEIIPQLPWGWYEIVKENEEYKTIEIGDRNHRRHIYSSSSIEYNLMAVIAEIDGKIFSRELRELRDKFENENGYELDDIQNTMDNTIRFLHENGINKDEQHFSIMENLVPNTEMICSDGEQYSYYTIDENSKYHLVQKFEIGNTDALDLLLMVGLRKKHQRAFEKQMFDFFSISSQEIPTEIKKLI